MQDNISVHRWLVWPLPHQRISGDSIGDDGGGEGRERGREKEDENKEEGICLENVQLCYTDEGFKDIAAREEGDGYINNWDNNSDIF